MPSSANHVISWSDSINALELVNPNAFNYFYHFHSMHGLREGDLSPFKRLTGIGDHCESAIDSLTEDFLGAIADLYSIDKINMDSYCVSEEGFHLSDSLS